MGGSPSPLVRVVEYALSSPIILWITDIILTTTLVMIFAAAGCYMVDLIKYIRARLQEAREAQREEDDRDFELELAIREMQMQEMRAIAARDGVGEDQLATLEEEEGLIAEEKEETGELEEPEEEPELDSDQEAAPEMEHGTKQEAEEKAEQGSEQYDEKDLEQQGEHPKQSEVNTTATDPEKQHLEQQEEEHHPNTDTGLSTRHVDRSHSLHYAYPAIDSDDYDYDSNERDETYDGTHACPALWEPGYLRRDRWREEREEARSWGRW
jgi:hypothetical protein